MNLRISIISLFTILVLSFFVEGVHAQNEIRVPRSSLKVAKEGLLEAMQNIQEGDSWVRKGKGAIPKGLEYYLKAYAYNPNCAELNLKIGLCYLRSDRKSNALKYVKALYEKDSASYKDIKFTLATAYHHSLEFDKAIEYYDAFYKSLKRKDQKKVAERVYKRIDECKSGKELVANPKRAVFQNLGDSINSEFDDYNSLLVKDSLMFITSRRPSGKRPKPDKVRFMYDEDIYASVKKNGIWDKATYLNDDGFNSKRNDALVWVSADGDTRYLYDGYKKNGDIMVSDFKNNNWSRPRKISRSISSDLSETSISITADGNTLYFVSDDSRGSIGGKDISFTRKNTKGKWDSPANIGASINTIYDEECVYVSPDGKTLYFSSKGHNSMGGYDIFRCTSDGTGNWSKPENMGYPINTPDDEMFYRPTDISKVAYYSAKRDDSKGQFDIYKVIYLGAEKKMLLTAEDQFIACFDKPIAEVFDKRAEPLPIILREPPKTEVEFYLRGMVTDIKRKTAVIAKIDLIDLEKSQVVATTITSETGRYDIKLPEIKNYGIEVRAKDYMFFLDVVSIPKNTVKEMWRSVALTKIEVGSKIVLKNIYFESGKAKLTAASGTELDKLVTFLQENNEIKVEISGHTDNVGSAAVNTKLSGARAQAVVDYLIAHGIPQELLISKGYGSVQPISPNNTAKGRQLNRRVEFKILSKE